jgi:hypothetical protein
MERRISWELPDHAVNGVRAPQFLRESGGRVLRFRVGEEL